MALAFVAALTFLVLQLFASGIVNAKSSFGPRVLEWKHFTSLISDVQKYYGTSSVFIVHSGNDENMYRMMLLMCLIREFSSKDVLSLTMNYTDVTERHNYYTSRIIRPLFVVLLTSSAGMQTFQQVTSHYDMSYPFWLLMFISPDIQNDCNRPMGNVLNLKFNSQVMVKCYGRKTIWEWYSIHGDRTKVCYMGTWDPIARLRIKVPTSLYERRRTLDGKLLRIASVKDSPFTLDYDEVSATSVFSAMMKELSSTLNFSMEIVHSEEPYGFYNESNKRWTGVIGRLARYEADIGVAVFTMTGQRLDVVDFSLPIILSYDHLYLKQPQVSTLQWSAYFKVYELNIWLAMAGLYILVPLIITFMRLIKMKGKVVPPNYVSENYLFVWSIYCQQGIPDFPTTSPMRIAYFSLLVSSAVFFDIYSACLISYLTVTSPSMPFKDLIDFAYDGSYKLIALQQSSDFNLFATSKDIVIQQMMKLMLAPEHLPNTMMNGFIQACSGNKIAFYATEAVKTRLNARIPCNLMQLQSGRIGSLGMTLTKHSPYTKVINFHLQKLRDVGIMRRLHSSSYMNPPDNKYSPMSIRGIATLLVILGAGFLLSFFILMAEVWMHRSKLAKYHRKIVAKYPDGFPDPRNLMLNEKNVHF